MAKKRDGDGAWDIVFVFFVKEIDRKTIINHILTIINHILTIDFLWCTGGFSSFIRGFPWWEMTDLTDPESAIASSWFLNRETGCVGGQKVIAVFFNK